MKTGHDLVDRINQIKLQGNIIPPQWFKHIKFPSGKPNVLAILILSDIIYWYRPTIIRDEETGEILDVKKKFKLDMLQRDYQAFGDQYGYTKRQARDAIKLLEDMRLVRKELRTITLPSGRKANNVLFIEPIVESIIAITFESASYDTSTSQLLHHDGTASTLECQTNTLITTKITTEGSSTNEHAREIGESDGTLQPADKGDHSHVEGKVSHTPEQFAQALENRFIQLRGRGLQVSAKDIKAIYEVVQSGVSLEDALRWLEETFANYEPDYPGQHINAFEYCKHRILHQAHLKRKRLDEAKNAKRGDWSDQSSKCVGGAGKGASGVSAETERLESIAREKGLITGEIRDTDFDF
jgi:hypothetical protein